MRIKVALGIWLLSITLAWMAVAPPDLGLSPLVDAQGAAFGVVEAAPARDLPERAVEYQPDGVGHAARPAPAAV